jgi:hypothetical protein
MVLIQRVAPLASVFSINVKLEHLFHSKLQKGALDSQPQVIKFTSCLPMVDGSLRVLRLLPPLKLAAMI